MTPHDAEPTPNHHFSVYQFSHPIAVRRSAIALMIVLACVARSAGALRASASLGMTVQCDLPFTPMFPAFIHYSSARAVDLACIDPSTSQLVILKNDGHGGFGSPVVAARIADAASMTTGDLNMDGIDDLVIVRREQRQIDVLLSSTADSAYTLVRYPVKYYPEHAVIADLNNDRIPDIISCGRVSSGITLLRGTGKGTFMEAKELFPDIPVSDVYVRKLNGDHYPDIILYNWLAGEMSFSIGMGDLQFAEQTLMPFQKDSSGIVFINSNGDAVTDFAIASNERNTLQIYEGDGLGSYHPRQALSMSINPTRLEAVHIRSKQNDDVLASNAENGMFSLYLNRGDGTYDDEIQFGGSEGVLLTGDVDGDGQEDLASIAARGRSMQIYYNGQKAAQTIPDGEGAVSYPVGRIPLALAVGDFNNDGRDDIAAANTGTSTVSLLLSGTSSMFTGQRSFETVSSPTSIRLYARSDSSVTFVFAHATRSRVSVLSLAEHVRNSGEAGIESQLYTIPTAERPALILSDLAVQRKSIEFYVASGSPQTSLSYYQQVKGTKFIERSFKPIIPARILAGAVTDFNGDGRPDLAYVYGDQSTGRNVLGITFSDTTGQYRSNTLSYVFPDSVMKRCVLLFDDFDGDGQADCLLAQSPANTLGVALGTGGGKFRGMRTVARGMITGAEQVQTLDFNGDGITDIAFMDGSSSELFLLLGRGNGTFSEKQFILDVPIDGAFRCADMNRDGAMDVVVTDPKRNIVTIQYAKHR
ncbi:MAG: FG-GAP repeat domain-containing protein [Acidobacteriota bacterium]